MSGRVAGLTRFAVLFVIDLSTRRVEIAGIAPEPDSAWVTRVSRNLTDASDGFLRGKRFLIHDRDPLFSGAFRETLAATGVQVCASRPIPRISTRTRNGSYEPLRYPASTG
jgi:hypothetical protein